MTVMVSLSFDFKTRQETGRETSRTWNQTENLSLYLIYWSMLKTKDESEKQKDFFCLNVVFLSLENERMQNLILCAKYLPSRYVWLETKLTRQVISCWRKRRRRWRKRWCSLPNHLASLSDGTWFNCMKRQKEERKIPWDSRDWKSYERSN